MDKIKSFIKILIGAEGIATLGIAAQNAINVNKKNDGKKNTNQGIYEKYIKCYSII